MKIYSNRSMVWGFFLTCTVTACSQSNYSQDKAPQKSFHQHSQQQVSTETEKVKIAQIESVKPQVIWTELSSGLWQSNQGYFGLQVSILKNKETLDFTTDYLTHVFTEDGDTKNFNEVIDVDSFQQLADSNYYKDKNHIYRFIAMARGGTFAVLNEVDYESFVVLNYCFAKDKHKVFHWRGMGDDYDYDSFKLCTDSRCIAKDKNSVYTVC